MLNVLLHKDEFFGSSTLDRELLLSDLKKEDINVLTAGMFHFQSETDRSGRYIVYCFNKVLLSGLTAEAMTRAAIYAAALFSALPDVDKKGLVAIYIDVGDVGQSMGTRNLGWFLKMMSLAKCVPVKYSSMHYCVNTSTSNAAMNKALIGTLVNAFPSYSRVRTRFHYGSLMELRYKLQSHGIPMQEFPIDSNGKIRQDMIDKSCLKHYRVDASQYREEKSVNRTIRSAETTTSHNFESVEGKTKGKKLTEAKTVEPKRLDVLLGRGRKIQNHPGNVELRRIIEQCQLEYDSSQRVERRQMIKQIKNSCNDKGIQFLKQNERKAWVLAESAEADEKIRQHFRTGRKKKWIGFPLG
mmetsp:Transcript_20308/g.49796  ORF Transcript_20308/g.49796 Transcript_20308/m.49796 type:complete len:355 (-) Transcript_20308:238-1302(-)